MSRIFTILLSLIMIFWGIPQNRIVSSADLQPCSQFLDIRFGYAYNNGYYDADTNSTFPEDITAVYFTFTEKVKNTLPNNKYRFASKDDPNHPYSPEAKAQNGRLEIGFDNKLDSTVLNKGDHGGNLQREVSPGKFQDFCTGIKYYIGNNYTTQTCKITLSADPPTIDQKILATVSQAPMGTYNIIYYSSGTGATVNYFINRDEEYDEKVLIDQTGSKTFKFTTSSAPRDSVTLRLFDPSGRSRPEFFCAKTFPINPTAAPNNQPTCSVFPLEPNFTTPISVNAINLDATGQYRAAVINRSTNEKKELLIQKHEPNSNFFTFEEMPPLRLMEGNYFAQVYKFGGVVVCTTQDFHVKGAREITQAVPSATPCTGAECTKGGGDPCNDGRGPAMKTAIGCIHTNPSELTKDLMTFIIGIGGGLAFLMMLFGAFQMLTSAGNPETLNAGKSRLTSAIIGLLFVIFAVLLLQIIGVDILQIPGFGR